MPTSIIGRSAPPAAPVPSRRLSGLAGLLLAATALSLPGPAAAQSFLGLGYLAPPGTPNLGGNAASIATRISANGGTVIGYSSTVSLRNIPPGTIFAPVDQAFTWTAAGGMLGLPIASPLYVPSPADDYDAASRNMAVSANGGVVVGWAKVPSNNPALGTSVQATMITGGTLSLLGYLVADTTPIPDLLGGGANLPLTSMALGVSGDGSIVVGSSYNGNQNDIQGFWWTAGGGMQALPYLPGVPAGLALSQANAISADGSVIGGFSSDTTNGELQAVLWSGAGFASVTPIGFLAPGFPGYSSVLALSANGGVAVGGSSNAAGELQAFRWTAGGGMVGLPGLPGGVAAAASAIWPGGFPTGLRPDSPTGFSGPYGGNLLLSFLSLPPVISLAYALSPDGSVVVGTAMDSTATGQAVRWDSSGIATISGLLTAAGVATTGWVLNAATGIAVPSAGTQLITGYGTIGGLTQAWLARLSTAADAPPSGLTTPGALLVSVATMPAASTMSERITWSNQRELLLAALRYGSNLPVGAITGYIATHGAGWDPPSRAGGLVSGSVGLIGQATGWLRLGMAVSQDWEQDQVARPTSRGLIWGTGGHLFALVGEADQGPRLAATVNYEEMGAKLRRRYVNGSGTADGTGRTTGNTIGAAFRAAWGLPLDAATTISPFGQLNWQVARFRGYAESYAGNPFPAVFGGQSYTGVVLAAGVEAEHRFDWGRAWASASYASRVVGLNGATISGRFVDLNAFSVRGVPVPERQWADVTFGASVKLATNLEAIANIGLILPTDSGQAGNSWHAYGSLGLAMTF